jgi:homoserine kinase type II
MAVYTPLEEAQVRHMLSVYEVGELRAYTPVAAGSINTNYRIETEEGAYYLRVNENKRFRDLIYEKNLLLLLEARAARLGGVRAPRIVENCIGGHFFPIEKEKYACLFEELPGRELAIFEREPEHVEQLGAFVARAHRALRRYRGRRRNPYGAPVMRCWLDDIYRRCGDQDLVSWLDARARLIFGRRRPLARGVIHGDLFMNNTKWRRGGLDAVFDWEMAGPDHLMLDVGICLNAWCWSREEQRFEPALCQALLRGYRSVRALRPGEQRGLYWETLLGALRFTLSRIRDFHLQGQPAGDAVPVSIDATPQRRSATDEPVRDFLDYREYRERLDALHEMGRHRFRELCAT